MLNYDNKSAAILLSTYYLFVLSSALVGANRFIILLFYISISSPTINPSEKLFLKFYKSIALANI